MTYGMGRFQPTSYKNYRGANIFTDIFEVGANGVGNAFLHGRIYDPSELGILPPFPKTVEVENIKADYKNGILSVTLPKVEEAKLKKAIKVKNKVELEIINAD